MYAWVHDRAVQLTPSAAQPSAAHAVGCRGSAADRLRRSPSVRRRRPTACGEVEMKIPMAVPVGYALGGFRGTHWPVSQPRRSIDRPWEGRNRTVAESESESCSIPQCRCWPMRSKFPSGISSTVAAEDGRRTPSAFQSSQAIAPRHLESIVFLCFCVFCVFVFLFLLARFFSCWLRTSALSKGHMRCAGPSYINGWYHGPSIDRSID